MIPYKLNNNTRSFGSALSCLTYTLSIIMIFCESSSSQQLSQLSQHNWVTLSQWHESSIDIVQPQEEAPDQKEAPIRQKNPSKPNLVWWTTAAMPQESQPSPAGLNNPQMDRHDPQPSTMNTSSGQSWHPWCGTTGPNCRIPCGV